VPGVVVIFANRRPRSQVISWNGKPLELGRAELSQDGEEDALISRKHLRLVLDGSDWQVTDLDSRNGSFRQGAAFSGAIRVPSGGIVRVGGALLLLLADTLDFHRYGLEARGGVIAGPKLRKQLDTIEAARKVRMLKTLLVTGESGSGKEIAAQVFHGAEGNAQAPFVAVNCATIPKDLAERLLFGSRRGAFSGATDAPGHVQAAHGGTLFLDEVAELPADVQAKLLRMLETGEVMRLGATSYERVDVRVCAATWRDLRGEVALGRFREDLYFRVGQPELRLPPLRERLEEIPWHVADALERSGSPWPLEASAAFIEACTQRPWPGNVRELRAEVRRCAAAVCMESGVKLTAEHLSTTAGMPIPRAESAPPASAELPTDEIADALRAEGGNVLGAARRLGVHRNKVRRWLERHGLGAEAFKDS
jgi:DNA-binding NtrC family response regulator